MGRIKRYKWLLIVLTLCVAFGGVAYAGYNVAVVASSPSDQWHACVSNTGVVRVSTIRLNSYPATCPRSTDTVRTWNSSGPSGANGLDGTNGQDGATGPTGPTGPAGDPTTTTSSSSTSSTSSTTTTTAAPTTPYVSANILLASGPQDVEFDGNNIWVAQYDSHKLAKVDTSTNTIDAQVLITVRPYHLSFDGSDLWATGPRGVCCEQPTFLEKYQTGTSALTEFIVGNSLVDGTQDVAYDGRYIWLTDALTHYVFKIDPATNSVVAQVNVGAASYGAVFDGTYIWVSLGNPGKLIKINPVSDTVTASFEIGFAFGTENLAFDGNSVWFKSSVTSVARLNVATGAISDAVEIGGDAVDMVVVGQNVWVAATNGTISRINISSLAISATVNVGGDPRGIAFGAGSIWVTSQNVTGHLYRIDNI